jgi:hypothetical protein
MFRINTINITNREDPINCELYFDWNGIQIIYGDKTDFIVKTNIKNVTSNSSISKKGKNKYLNIENHILYLSCNVNNKLQHYKFLVFEDCEHIIHWLKKNYRRDDF